MKLALAILVIGSLAACNTVVDASYNPETGAVTYRSERPPFHDVEVGKASLKAPNGTELLIEGVKTDSQRAMEVAEFAAKAATVLAQQAREDRITAEAKAEAADLFDDENTESEPVEGDK